MNHRRPSPIFSEGKGAVVHGLGMPGVTDIYSHNRDMIFIHCTIHLIVQHI